MYNKVNIKEIIVTLPCISTKMRWKQPGDWSGAKIILRKLCDSNTSDICRNQKLYRKMKAKLC